MGITGLLPYLKKASRECSLSEFRGCTVAVDSYCWLHKGAFSCAEKLALGEDTEQYVYYCMKLVNKMLEYNIKPVMVFDGCNLPSKKDTEKQRRERRQTNKKKAAQFLREGRRAEARQCLQMSIDVTSVMALKLMEACRNKGVDCIVAPYEADAQLAYLVQIGVAQLVITEDSDLVLYGCDKILYKMDTNGHGVLVEKTKLNLALGLQADMYSFEKFRYMCILSGCDYLPNLPGIGLVKATKVFKLTRNPNIETVLKKLPTTLKMSNLTVSQEYVDNFTKANNTILYQLVYDPIARKLRPLHDYPSDVNPEEMTYAGPFIPDGKAYQIALGNLCIASGERIAHFDPNTFVPQSKNNQKGGKLSSALHLKSIWDPAYKPMPKMGTQSCASQDSVPVQRTSEQKKEVTVKYKAPKNHAKKRSIEDDIAAEEEDRKELLRSYAVDKSPSAKRRRVELQEIPNNIEKDDMVDILASLVQGENDTEVPVPEDSKENSPKKNEDRERMIMKSPPNKFAVKSKVNKDLFDLNAKKPVTDVKSRFFTQSMPLQKTKFFNMLGDHQPDGCAPSLPPDTNEEDVLMNDKGISGHASFGLDSVLQRAEAKIMGETENADMGNSSPYGSFRSKLSSFKSGFDKLSLTSSTKSRNQFKPVKAKQTTLENFENNVKRENKPIPNTNFFDEECEGKSKVGKRPPSLPPATHEEDDQMEIKCLSQRRPRSCEVPFLPSLIPDGGIHSGVGNNVVSLPELREQSPNVSQSLSASQIYECGADGDASIDTNPNSDRPPEKKSLKKSNSIISMFRRSQNKEKHSPFYKQQKTEESSNVSERDVSPDALVNLTNTTNDQDTTVDESCTKTPVHKTPVHNKLGPCRRFGLSKSVSNKKRSPAALKDKQKQTKLTESLSVYFFNKKVNKIPPSASASGENPDATPETSTSLTRQETNAIPRKLTLQ